MSAQKRSLLGALLLLCAFAIIQAIGFESVSKAGVASPVEKDASRELETEELNPLSKNGLRRNVNPSNSAVEFPSDPNQAALDSIVGKLASETAKADVGITIHGQTLDPYGNPIQASFASVVLKNSSGASHKAIILQDGSYRVVVHNGAPKARPGWSENLN